MRRLCRNGALFALTLSLAACGFHLRGVGQPLRPLSFASLTVDGSGPVYDQLMADIRRDGRVQLAGKGQTAQAVLALMPPQTSKDVLTVNRAGKVNEYQLVLTQHALLTFAGSDVPQPLSATVRRTLSYSENVVLGKEMEEAQLWASMQREAANMLVRRLSYIQPPKAGEASAGQGDAAARKP